MNKVYGDCWKLPSEGHCHTVLEADGEEALTELMARHATEVHGHTDGPELRHALRETFSPELPTH
jgi:hypothetical protein